MEELNQRQYIENIESDKEKSDPLENIVINSENGQDIQISSLLKVDNFENGANEKTLKTYSLEEYADIITNADLRRLEREVKTQGKDRLEELTRKHTQDRISEEQLYENAEKLGISREDVTLELKLRYQKNSEMIEDLMKVGGDYNLDERREYEKKEILAAMKFKYPHDEFEVILGKEEKSFWKRMGTSDYLITVYRIKERPVKKRFFWKTYFKLEKQKERLAEISTINGLYLYSPDFLSACSDTLMNFNQKFSWGYYTSKREYKVKVENF